MTYELQYLALCAQHPELRRECPCATKTYGLSRVCSSCWNQGHNPERHRPKVCHVCQGQGWLPKPEAERLDALVELAGRCKGVYIWRDEEHQLSEYDWVAEVGTSSIGYGDKHWQALAAALTQVQEAAYEE